LIEFFGELEGGENEEEAEELIKLRAGIDPRDFEDKDVQEILGVPDEVKQGLYSSDSEDE
jgi:hypothetical protein